MITKLNTLIIFYSRRLWSIECTIIVDFSIVVSVYKIKNSRKSNRIPLSNGHLGIDRGDTLLIGVSIVE